MPIDRLYKTISEIRKDASFLKTLSSGEPKKCYVLLAHSKPSFIALPYDISQKVAGEFGLSVKTLSSREIYRSALNSETAQDMANKFDLIQRGTCHYSFIPYSDDRMKFVESL